MRNAFDNIFRLALGLRVGFIRIDTTDTRIRFGELMVLEGEKGYGMNFAGLMIIMCTPARFLVFGVDNSAAAPQCHRKA